MLLLPLGCCRFFMRLLPIRASCIGCGGSDAG